MFSLNRRFIPTRILWIIALSGLSVLFNAPANAQQPCVHRTSNCDTKPAWWITQRGLGGGGLFECVNANNEKPALQGIPNGSGVAIDGRFHSDTNNNGNGGWIGGPTTGVYGLSNGTNGFAVLAEEKGNGIWGCGVRATSLNGVAVQGESWNNGTFGQLGGTENGVYGVAPSSGYAGRFDGNVFVSGTITNPSDIRYKTHIATFPNALGKVLALRGVTFDWKRKEFPEMRFDGGKHIGFLAQEVEKVLPELVHKNKQGYRAVDYTAVVPVLVEAMKVQEKRITALEADNAAMKSMRVKLFGMSSLLPETGALPLLTGAVVLGLGLGRLRRRK